MEFTVHTHDQVNMKYSWLFVSFFALVHASATAQVPSNVLVVDANASQPSDGLTWPTAFSDLQDALDATATQPKKDEIWVAAGTYYPSLETMQGNVRSRTFALQDGIKIFGGFLGNAHPNGGEETRAERSPETQLTYLDGAEPGMAPAYHVVYAFNVGIETRLDGFVIRGGRANGPQVAGTTFRQGGGLYATFSSFTVSRCRFTANSCVFAGGAVSLETVIFTGEVLFINCQFDRNLSEAHGGAVNLTGDHGTFINCLFAENEAVGWGGAIHTDYQVPPTLTMQNCTVVDGMASTGGGVALQVGATMVADNCIFWGNRDASSIEDEVDHIALLPDAVPAVNQATLMHTCLEFLKEFNLPGHDNIGSDPLFVGAGNYHLTANSPCKDAGDQQLTPADTEDVDDDGSFTELTPDLDSFDRLIDLEVDMGAYEFQGTCPADITGDGIVDVDDLLIVLGAWGTPEGDITGDQNTDVDDLLLILSSWGPCSAPGSEPIPDYVLQCLNQFGTSPERTVRCIENQQLNN